MKQRNLMVLTLSCALLIIIELGVSIIYSDYIYNPAKGLISINVASQSYNDPNWEPGMENPTSSQNAANLMQEIDDWANSAKAAVIHKNAFSAGCGYSDYSGWLLSALGISKANLAENAFLLSKKGNGGAKRCGDKSGSLSAPKIE